MKIFDVLTKCNNGTLTIAEAVDILADQVNVPDISHVHMHMRDGFAVYVKPVFQLNDDQSRNHYEEAHMTTPARAGTQGAVPVWNGIGTPPGNRFHVDATRMATAVTAGGRSKYDLRSHQTEIAEEPAETELRPTIGRFDTISKKRVVAPAPGLPSITIIGDVGDVRSTALSNGGVTTVPAPVVGNGDWKRDSASGDASVTYVKQVIHAKVPKIPGSEKHTMFEDSESMAMYLCAALRSTAGRHALTLLQNKPLGDSTTVAVFSKTAVRQISQHIDAVNKDKGSVHPAPVALERITEMQPGVARTQVNPNPVADTFKRMSKAIDHIVLVLGKRADESLNVVTFYPSPDTTLATIGADNAGDTDLLEPVFGQAKTPLTLDHASMDLRW